MCMPVIKVVSLELGIVTEKVWKRVKDERSVKESVGSFSLYERHTDWASIARSWCTNGNARTSMVAYEDAF